MNGPGCAQVADPKTSSIAVLGWEPEEIKVSLVESDPYQGPKKGEEKQRS